jgi:transcriptional regulator EpsA
MEIVAASLDITRRTHLFSWLQGSFQALVPHEIMVCGIRTGEGDHIQFDHFSSTRYFTDQHLEEATRPNHGVIWRAMAAWSKTHKPIFLAEGLAKGEFGLHSVPFVEPEGDLQKAELKNIAAYGVSGHAGVSSFFCFSRVNTPLDAQCAYILQLLIPHLHVILSRLMVAGIKPLQTSTTQNKTITSREAEILQWVHEGKTNQDIADTLHISALTVKNHVQSILRKLDVQNRSHAAVKAMNLGLIKPTKPRSKSQKKHDVSSKAYANVIISAAQVNPELMVTTSKLVAQSLNADAGISMDAFNRQKSKNLRSNNSERENPEDGSEHESDLVDQTSVLGDALLANQAEINHTLTEAELLEKMRIEERTKRKNRIAARRKMLTAKGLLNKQGKSNPQTA